MAPGIAFLIPWFILFSKLRMIDTYPAVMLTHMVVVLPLVIWVLVGFFEEVPAELEEAGLIDGCTRLGGAGPASRLPLARPRPRGHRHPRDHLVLEQLHLLAGDRGETTRRTLPVAIFNFVFLRLAQLGRAHRRLDHHPRWPVLVMGVLRAEAHRARG